MTTRLYLDTRALKRDGTAPLKLGISRHGKTAYMLMGINIDPKYWDTREQRLLKLPLSKWSQRPQAEAYINAKRSEIETLLLRMESDGQLHKLTAQEVRDKVLAVIEPQDDRVPLADMFDAYINKTENKRTREIYTNTRNKVVQYGEITDMQTATSADMEAFYLWLRDNGCQSVNGRNIHMRNIRAVYNHAMRLGVVTSYPFRNYTIREEETQKRSLTLQQLRALLAMPLKGYLREYRDLFMLSFLLIGINFADLCDVRKTDIHDGRLQYRRRKTGKWYNIKILPRAQALIDQYAGTEYLISIAERYTDTHNYLKHINKGLHKLHPDLTTYWARHTWATLAYNECKASIDTISAGLGHAYGSKVTQVYINPSLDAVDKLNQQLADLIFAEFPL